MNPKPDRFIHHQKNLLRLLPGLLLAAWLLAPAGAFAQDAVIAAPQYSITPPAMRQYSTNDLQVFDPSGDVPPISESPLLKWGLFSIRPHVFYRFLYGDSIPSATSNFVATFIQEFSPGVLVNIGEHWSIDYTPTLRYYSSSEFRDTTDHYVRLTGGTAYGDWLFGLSQSYSKSSPSLVETGTQTDQQTFLTGLTAAYRFNSKMFMDLSLSQNIVETEEFTSYKEWSTLDWLHYQFLSRLDAAMGIGFGYVDVNVGDDMTYERILGRVAYRPTDKISLEGHGGVEIRQFLTGDNDALVNPLVGGMIQYQPFEVTRLSLTVDRTVGASYFESQVTETTEVIGSLNQRFLRVLFLNLAGGYHHVNYVAAGGGTARTDDYYTFDARLSTSFLKERASAAIFYQYSDNSSTTPGFTYISNQAGFELGYRF